MIKRRKEINKRKRKGELKKEFIMNSFLYKRKAESLFFLVRGGSIQSEKSKRQEGV